MHAGLLDVLHDAAEEQLGAVVERVDVDLDRVVEEAVDQHRPLRRDLGRPADVVLERALVVDDLHAAATQDVRRADQHGIADLVGDLTGAAERRRHAVLGRGQVGLGEHLGERATLLGELDRGGLRADDRHVRRLEARGQAQRRLAAELHDDADDRTGLLLGVHDLEDVLERQRLEVEPVGGVVVGRDGLGVAVDHDRLVADLGQRQRGVDARVVELDALPDAVGPAAEDQDRRLGARLDLGLLVVRRVVVGRLGGELGGTRVDGLVDRAYAEGVAHSPDDVLAQAADLADLRVREAVALGAAQQRPATARWRR